MASRFFNCVARLNQAAGRKLSDAEVHDIFERVAKAEQKIRADLRRGKTPAAATTKYGASIDGVINQAAAEAARVKLGEAQRVEQNAARQVVKLAQRLDDAKAMKQAGLGDVEAITRIIANRADGRSNTFSLESRYTGISADMKRRIQETWAALGHDWLGFVQHPDKIKLLIREMKGENTGDALAKKGAKAWLDMAEEFRTRFNDNGGEIGKLDDWALPQHHSHELVARAGKDTWVNAVLPALDRARYVDDAGIAWSNAQLRDFLGKAWETIASNGYSKVVPGQFKGQGAVANRGAQERQIHFRDAGSYLAYWAHFGDRTFPDILMGHVETMARNIAMVEHFGPNPDLAYRTLRDTAAKAQIATGTQSADAKTRAKAEPETTQQLRYADNLWNVAAGHTTPVAHSGWAKGLQTLRDLNVAGKLGSAFWASFFGDKVMLETMSHLNDLPAIQRWRNELAMLNPAAVGDRALLHKQGLMLEHMRDAMARFGEEFGRSSWSGKLANAVMRVSGMNAINEWRRGAFGLSLMSTLGEMVGKPFPKGTDMHLLQSYGINEFDWKVWKLAQPEDLGHGNTRSLTPEAIMAIPDAALKKANIIGQVDGPEVAQRVRVEAVTKLLGAVNSESRMAIVEPGWRERAQIANVIGEGPLAKAVFQFKSFPFAQFERMWDAAMSRPSTGGKVGTLAAVMTMTTLAGAMLMQTREMLSGKDPRPVTDWKFWLAAFLNGGSLGIYGDFLYSINQTRYGSGPLEALAGPTLGPMMELLATQPLAAIKGQVEGKQTHFWAQEFQDLKGFVPGANLWYTKAAVDHILMQNVMETLSPGYLSSIRSKTQREYGQDWFWSPGEFAPHRPPDLNAALRPRP